MSMNYRTEEYYKRFIELQEKLRKSEEERLKLEMKFNEMGRVTREEEQMHYRKLRTQYKRFLEEDRRRQDRNERILRTLDRIDSRVAVLIAKTERFKLLRQQYHIYLDRVYRTDQPKKPEAPQGLKEATDEKKTHPDDIVQTYLQNLSSNKLREMLKKEEESRPRLPITITTDADERYNYSDLYSFNHGELRPNYANTIADDIMHSIYSKQSRPSDTKLTLPKEFNNNFTSPVVSTNKFEQQPSKNYEHTSLGLGKYSVGLKQHDEVKNFASEDTETDDFSESEEILYKNPSEFNKSKWRNSDMTKETGLTQFDNNINARNETQFNPILSNTTKDIPRTNLEKVLPVSQSSAVPSSRVEDNVDSTEGQNMIDNKFEYERMVAQNTPQDNTSTGNRKELIVNQTLPDSDLSQKEPVLVNPTGSILEADLNQYKKEVTNLQTFDANISRRKQEAVEPKETEKDYVREYSENISPDKDMSTEKPLDEQQLRKPQTETVREPVVERPIKEVDEVKLPEKPQESFEEPQKQLPAQQIQEQQIQQVVESQESHTTPTRHGEIDMQDTIQQPPEQQNENVDSTSYNQPKYEESEQSYPQYNENAPEAQQYDDQGQYVQQYDESGQPIVQYDVNSQPIQQYDETGQPIAQYTENTGQLQQYDEQGQPIQQFNQQGDYDDQNQYLQQYATPQYDEHGQLIAQYDEHGQLIPQYDEHGQLIQQYDETGQLIQQFDTQYGENQQYDENGQLIQSYDYGESAQPQYDENGQLLQQPYEGQQYYGQEYEQNIEAVDEQNIEAQQNVEPILPEATPDNEKDVEEKKEDEEPKKTSNVMEMLDTDTESMKQDTKISHDSDFDFSNG